MRLRKMVIAAFAIAALLLAATWSFYTVFVKAPTELAAATAKGIQEVFNFTPRVKIDKTVVIEQNTPIMEVATVARQLTVDYSWSHTWLGSTKTIRLVGVFTAKAGFDLKEPFTIVIERSPLRVKASMSPPKLLSLSMDSYKIVVDESGWWNRVSNTDREMAVRELQSTARAEVESSGILEEAKLSIEQRIREIVEKNGATVEFLPPSGL